MTYDQAKQKLYEMMDNPNLIKHCLAVEAAMLAYADYFEVSKPAKTKWAIAGLLHDADYQKYPDKHPAVIVDWLKKQNADPDLVNAVAAHGYQFGVAPETLMAEVLRAVDELTGLIIAVALVKGKKLDNVRVESVLKKIKDKAFARGVNRQDIKRGAQDLNMSLEDHIQHVLVALQKISDKLGL
ncbi:MAG: HD domain-containing protein [bacterium]|nr:HD domain-containing protein [bacterium]